MVKIKLGWVGSFTSPVVCPLGNNLRHPLKRRLGGPRRHFRHWRNNKYLVSARRSTAIPPSSSPTHRLFTIPTTLAWLRILNITSIICCLQNVKKSQEKIIFFKPEIAFLKYCRFCNFCFLSFTSIKPAETFNGKFLQKNSIKSTYSQHFGKFYTENEFLLKG